MYGNQLYADNKCSDAFVNSERRESDFISALKCIENQWEKIGALKNYSNEENSVFETNTEYRTKTKRSKEEKHLGRHRLCVLSGVAGPGGFDMQCRVYLSNGEWYLLNVDETGNQTTTCHATCFD